MWSNTIDHLLIYGNAKLGAISNFALPARITCPGANKFCKKYCYGVQNWYREAHVKKSLLDRLEATKQGSFADRMIQEITSSKVTVVRIHVVGDFYSNEYIDKWHYIIRSCPKTRFYGYTRSWRVPELKDKLLFLQSNSNLKLRASVDFTHEDRPDFWSTFSVVDGEGTRCPHDLGKVQYCRDCRICWTNSQPIYVKVRWARLWANFSPELI